MTQFARVILPMPLDREFTYLVPEWLSAKLQPGVRVRVPFGPRSLTGYFVGYADRNEVPVEKLKPIQAVLDPAPILDGNMLKLARWIADTYMCSWGEAVDAAVPRGVRRKAAGRAVTFAQLALDVEKCREILPQVEKKSEKQARVIRFLIEAPTEPAAFSEIERRIPGGPAAARALAKKNIVTLTSRTLHSDPFFDLHVEKSVPLEPTPEQAEALRAIEQRCAAGQFGVMLLHGVTGSGKTEVYLQAIAKCVAAGRQAIVLVPEISLTPQTVARFRSRFEHVAVLHSYLTDSQRAGQWLAIGSGRAQVVIGARSAVFAPVRNLGLIVIDEEHENSFKQDNAPRYHAREVAIERARLENAVVILGGATPSLESYENAISGRYELLKLPNRIEGRPLPPVEIVDMATEILDRTGIPLISRKLQHLAEEALARKEQVIFLLNRRGFATYVRCPRCRFVLRCGRCDVAMTYHKKQDRVVCHHCEEEVAAPKNCPECGLPDIKYLGIGTERIEEYFRDIAPDRKVARVDSDSMRTAASYKSVMKGLHVGDIDVLVGTQMVAKGLDFPNVTLVGVISGDTGFLVKDFRSAERTFQLITQVAGRAGRGPKGGCVIVQTLNPDHYSIIMAAKHDYESFARKELEFRRELNYPPFGRLLRVLVQGKDELKVRKTAEATAAKVRKAVEDAGAQLLGPAPAPFARLKDRYRWHIVIKAKNIESVRTIAGPLRDFRKAPAGVSVALDVDPQSLL